MPSPAGPERRWTRRQFLTTAGIVAVGGASVAVIYAIETGPQPAGGSVAVVPGSSPAATPQSTTVLSALASPTVSPSIGAGSTAGSATQAPTQAPKPTPSPTGAATARRSYRSRPDLSAPAIQIVTPARAVAPGYIFFTPNNGATPDGPMIVDNTGEPIWIHPESEPASTDLRVFTYQGAPVLTWWEGTLNGGNGDGYYVVADARYIEIARIKPVNGYSLDLHELQITPAGTALFLAGNPMAPDPARGRPWTLWDDVVQEIDIASGELIFEWHASEHIDPSESYVDAPTKPTDAYDAYHTNSIEVDTDGHLIVSARNTSAIYKVDRVTGEIHWRLGGRKSDFTLGPGVAFGWQHDARRRPDGSISIFDNEAIPTPSRGLVLDVDETNGTASLKEAFKQPHQLTATSEGNFQLLPNGNWFVGWGASPWFTEYASDATVLFDATFPGSLLSYRSYRMPWVGRPIGSPLIAAEAEGSNVTVFASWNGATEIATWDILAGPTADKLDLVGSAPRSGFETSVTVPTNGSLVAARARDRNGVVLGTSAPVSIEG